MNELASKNSVQALNNRLTSSKNTHKINTNKPRTQVHFFINFFLFYFFKASPQNESPNEGEEEVSENEQYSTTFAEDLQNLMANHQMTAPENLFSNYNFTQNFVQFLKNLDIKVINSQEEDAETEKLGQYILKASEIDDKYKMTF